MKKIEKFAGLVFALSLFAAPAHAAEKTAPAFDIHKKIEERASPSMENATILHSFAGNWDYTATVWTKAGEKPQSAKGSATNEVVLDNRFLSTVFTGYLSIDGIHTPYRGQGLIGFDTSKNSFTTAWADTLGTGIMTGSGKYDDREKTLTEAGRFTNPISGEDEKFRAELHIGEQSYTRTIFTTGKSGKETKLMEFTYIRPGLAKAE